VEEGVMGHYLFRSSYTQAGVQGVLNDGAASRIAAVEEAAKSVGGRVETAYWSFGAEDFVLIADLPDNAAAAALSLRVSATGTSAVSTTVLLTAAELDAARGLEVRFRPPGG
jgi:uncharacterized protein with GYD domain